MIRDEACMHEHGPSYQRAADQADANLHSMTGEKVRPLRAATWPRIMRVLLVNEFLSPDVASSGQHLSDLVEELLRAGHEVHVVCTGRRRAEDGEREPRLTIDRIPCPARRSRHLGMRAARAILQHARLGLTLLRAPRPDLIVSLTSPPMIAVTASVVCRLRRVPQVTWLMDLHPEAAVAHGVLGQRAPLTRVLRWLNRRMLRSAQHHVALGRFQARRAIEAGARDDRVSVVPIWNSAREFPRQTAGLSVRDERGWQGQCVVLYSGNAGLAHEFDTLLEATRRLQPRSPSLRLAFVGGGPRRSELKRRVVELDLTHCQFHDWLPREAVPASLAAADIHVTTLRPGFAGLVVPSKMTAALASARPVLFIGPEDSEGAELVREAGCGAALTPGDVEGVVSTLATWAADPVLRQRLGMRGREHFERRLQADVTCPQFRRILEAVADRRPVPRQVAAGTTRLREAASSSCAESS